MRLWLVAAVVVWGGCSAGELGHDEVLDFEGVRVGESRRLTFSLRNSGDARVEASLGSGDAQFVIEQTQVTVPPRGVVEVGVVFTPTQLGPSSTTLTINDAGLELRGFGIGPSLEVAQEVLLGRIRLVRGEPAPRIVVPLSVRNVGTMSSSLRVDASSDDAELCVGAVSADGSCAAWSGVELSAGERVEVPLVLQPVTEGERTWLVRFSNSTVVLVRATVDSYEPCVLSVPTSLEVPVGVPGALFITHTGPGTCVVRDLSITSTPDVLRFVDVPPLLPMVLASGERRAVRVGWLRPRPAMASGVIRIVPGGAAPIEIPVTLAPLDLGRCLVIAPGAIDLGTVRQGCSSATRTVSVYNSCASPVTIDSLRVTAGGGQPAGGPNCSSASPCPEFHLVSGFTVGTELASGTQPLRFQVRYSPIDLGPDTGAVALSAAGVEFIFAMQGRGDSYQRNTDNFRSDALPVIDWLMMVDTSPSFASRRGEVRDNVRQLLSAPRLQCVDLRVAFAPAEGDAGVQFALNDAGSRWTSSLGTDFVNRSLGAFDALPASSEVEACVGPAAQLMQGQPMRDGGSLHGICITDALEQSPNPMAALQMFGAGRSGFSWSTIVATAQSSCGVETIDDGVHASLVQASSGASADVCDPLWGQGLLGGGGPVCGTRTHFYLTSRPFSPADLDVRIEGQLVPNTWRYDDVNNAVVFDAEYAPRPGETLTVTYNQSCAP